MTLFGSQFFLATVASTTHTERTAFEIATAGGLNFGFSYAPLGSCLWLDNFPCASLNVALLCRVDILTLGGTAVALFHRTGPLASLDTETGRTVLTLPSHLWKDMPVQRPMPPAELEEEEVLPLPLLEEDVYAGIG